MALEKINPSLIEKYKQQEVNRHINTPEQLRALQLATALDDQKNKTIYLSLCKKLQPGLIEEAFSFVIDSQAESKAKLFMWKIKQLRLSWKQAGKNPDREVKMKKRRPKKIIPANLFD